ncbi:MAG: Mov34/MPN/PAD-1 family protein [Candidatus ainarchaeum sp.]|nr:Mov34/MPN/PAD-1 family protein [Candidatus ainarchaeum sp.]MDD3975889.1 Mov34/MPN/PAD-1 family protein [Candidatus ainarchaeum sp.]
MTKNLSWKIYDDVIESIMALSKSFYPNEFSGMLYAENNVIQDIYIIPKTISNRNNAIIRLDLVPMSLNIIGSVHSHPSGFGKPSIADLNFFSRKYVNIISYFPFSKNCFKVYDNLGHIIDNFEIIFRQK